MLLTNDDGVRAPGIYALYKALAGRPEVAVTLVAPGGQRSASSHAISMGQPIFADPVRLPDCTAPCYAVSGTPADAAKLAIQALLERQPDVVISGVNYGANLGTDVIYSGTVSAAVEAAICGVPAIAVSLCVRQMAHDPGQTDFSHAAEFAADLALRVAREGLPAGAILNVNVPELPPEQIAGVRVTRQGMRTYDREFVKRQDPRGRSYYWIAGHPNDEANGEDSDIAAVAGGCISVTPLQLDLTAADFLPVLRQWNL